MIRSLRRRARLVLSGVLLLAGCSLGAHAAGAAAVDGVSRSEMYLTLGAAGVVTFGAFWTLLGSAMSRMEASVNGLVRAMELHQADQDAHPPAISTKTRPILDTLQRLDTKQDEVREALAGLLAEHRLIRASGCTDCAVLRARKDAEPAPRDGVERRMKGRQ